MARPRKTDTRSKQLKARFTEAELATITRVSESTGMSVSDILRYGVLRELPPPSRRNVHPVKDRGDLAKLLGAVGRIGNNVNQLAHVANAGSWPESKAIDEAVADIKWMRQALMQSLGVYKTAQPATP